MPVVIVEWWAGRTVEQKKKVARDITRTMQEIGVPPEATHIIFQDISRDNWAVGGKLVSEQ